MLDHVPGLFTSTMAAIVRPRKTSSEIRRPLGFAVNELGDMVYMISLTIHRLHGCFQDLCNLRNLWIEMDVRVRVSHRNMSQMLAEIAEQPAALERTIAEERGKIAKLGNLLRARDIH